MNTVITSNVKSIKRRLNKESLWYKIKYNRHYYMLMAPFMLVFLVLSIIPILISVLLSFNNFNMY